MIPARFTQIQTSSFSPTETDQWLANAIDDIQCGADLAQIAALLRDIRDGLAPLVREPQHNHLWAYRVLAFGRRTDRGLKRKDRPNEDVTWASQGVLPGTEVPFGLFLVADGMGGHANGQRASRLARKALVSHVISSLLSERRPPTSEMLVEGVQFAHHAILDAAASPLGQGDMGTTITAALVIGGSVAYVANVGDSRTYRYRAEDGLEQITTDHSVIAQLLAGKHITAEQAAVHPKRNEIYRCLGQKEPLEVDTFTVDLHLGDTLLLCSDGVWGPVGNQEIASILKTQDAVSSKACNLVDSANAAGGPDNCSAVVVQIDTDVDELETLIGTREGSLSSNL